MIDRLQTAIVAYREGQFYPKVVTKYWSAKLAVDGARADLNIAVPDCNWTEEEMRRLMKDVSGKDVQGMMVYHPQELLGKAGLVRLRQMYPEMNSYATSEDTPITDTHKTIGWIKVEAPIDAPNLNTTQKDLEEHAKRAGFLPQRLTTYILASQATKDLIDEYFDHSPTYARLLGSRDGGGVVGAGFAPSGRLLVARLLSPGDHDPDLGGRFEEVKRA